MCRLEERSAFLKSPVSVKRLYSLWALPRPICSHLAVSLNVMPIPSLCQTTLMAMSALYADVLAGSIEVMLANARNCRYRRIQTWHMCVTLVRTACTAWTARRTVPVRGPSALARSK